jgi:hypothetical protein
MEKVSNQIAFAASEHRLKESNEDVADAGTQSLDDTRPKHTG